jgi:hypothetical protein
LSIAERFLLKLGGFLGGRLFCFGVAIPSLDAIEYDAIFHHPPAASAIQMTAELAWASWEMVGRRTMMMAQSTCSPAEYRRILNEKAALEIGGRLFSPNRASAEAFLTPWHSRATANAKRLRG